jgi:hypothetical protein
MDNLMRVHSVLRGERFPLDDGALKVLSFMVRRPDGCDAWITPGKLVMQLGPRSANHSYTPELAPAILSWLLDHAPHGYLPGGTMPYWAGAPGRWSYGPSSVWINAESDRITIMIRDGSDRNALDRTPGPLPAPIETPPEYVVGDHACPHCGVVPDSYRRLWDGALVCLACGASSRG